MIKILIRNILKYKGMSAINVAGLGFGLAIGAIIFLFISSELSYDRHHSRADRIYRVAHDLTTPSQVNQQAATPIALSPMLKAVEAIEKSARFLRDDAGILEYEGLSNREPQFCFADAEAFEIFDFQFVKGSVSKSWQTSSGLIITEGIAKKYFGEEDPIGKLLQHRNWGQKYTYEVTAVIRDIPQNSHFSFEIFAPFESPNNLWNDMHGKDWFHSGAWTYVLLKDGSSATSAQSTIQNTIQKHLPDELKEATSFYLQPLTDIYLDSHLGQEIEANGDRTFIAMLTVIGILIQVLACINFINVSTARSIERSKEVGIRKALGAFRYELVRQFLGESILVSAASALVALLTIPLVLPYFNFITGKTITVNYLQDPLIIVSILGAGVVIGIIAGLYPAFHLSGYRPASAFRPSTGSGLTSAGSGGGHALLRTILVSTQFTSALVLLIAVMTVNSQLTFLETKNLGYNKDNIVFVQGYNYRKARQLKEQLSQLPEITDLVTTRAVPGSEAASFDTRLFQTDLSDPKQRTESFYSASDYDFLDFFQIGIVKGRGFSPNFIADSSQSVLINEAMAKSSGWEDPIGKEITIFDMLGNKVGTRQVVGVMKDFHFQTLHTEVKPLVMGLSSRNGSTAFRIHSAEPFATIAKIKSIAGGFSNDESAVEVFFLDQDLGHQYLKEQRLANMVYLFTGLAILIAAIGLVGLSSFSAQRKSKELAIRKVFGASARSLAILFTNEFTVLVLISFVIAIPLSFLVLENWLSSFAYHVQQTPFNYFMSLVITLVMCWLTVMYYAMRAALMNPVETLKAE